MMPPEAIDSAEHRRLSRAAGACPVLKNKVTSLAEFLEVCDSLFSGKSDSFWFRGHDDISWQLCPSALRYKNSLTRNSALLSISEFRRIQEYRLPRAPAASETFKWMQIAQHHGLPTRLLDWTQSLATALYFACDDSEKDGIVYALNPRDLNRLSLPKRGIDIVDPEEHAEIVQKYFELGPDERKRGAKTIAVKPAWNSDRIILQQGMFTLHGDRFTLDSEQAPSLVGVAILGGAKEKMRTQLERVGVAEMFIFPEPEHVCSYLRKKILRA
jgi:hypothetical protein